MPPRYPPPRGADWALFAISLMFVLLSLFIWRKDQHLALMTFVMFGGCAFVFGAIIVRKLRYRKFGAPSVEVVGGVPIRPKRGRVLASAIYLTVLGASVWSFPRSGLIYGALGALIAVAGVFVALAVALRRLPVGFIQFDPEAFSIGGSGWHARIAWDDIEQVVEGELQDNPVLFMSVRDPTAIPIEPASATLKAMKAIGRNLGYTGAHFAIMTTRYGFDLPVLAAAVRRYAQDQAARAALRPRALHMSA
jgi:hypothetical protein